MTFLDTVRRAKIFLEQQGRVSLRALKLEFHLDDARLDSLIEELVDVQRVAARHGSVLEWIGAVASGESRPRAGPRPSAGGRAGPAAARPPAEAERRQLTVLFCDLVDSTELASSLDPEDWPQVVRRFQRASAQVVHRFEGHVAQYLGDGILVYFGYPRAHEDDAERAVRAGLGMLEALRELSLRLEQEHGISLAARITIHTGLAVVGEVGGGARREVLALGETANVAARLQDVARPGSVTLSAATLRLVQGLFVTHDMGKHMLRGVNEPVSVHEAEGALGVRSRLDFAAGRLTRFVGRQQELGLLLHAWERAVAGDANAMLVSGEAGLGKSRLALALRERIADQPHTWVECRCARYMRASAFHPVVDLLRQGLGFEEGESTRERLRRLEAGVRDADLDAAEAVPLLADLLGIAAPEVSAAARLSPELEREKTLSVLVDWALALGRAQPLLLLVEDLHWSDPSTLDLLGRLLGKLRGAGLLLLLTARPEFETPWPSRDGFATARLRNLRPGQAREVVDALDVDGALSEQTAMRIVERADGIPFYLEELTRTALDASPADPTTIPTTLQDSLMARLDVLGEAKDLAQVASVLGREFSYDDLAAVLAWDDAALRGALEGLVQAELLHVEGTPPRASYAFNHVLIQEAAYDSLLRSRRRHLHERVARSLERSLPERVDFQPEVLAYHFDRGGLPAQAIRYYERAGQRETARSATREALTHLRRGLELVALLPAAGRDRAELALRVAMGPALVAVRGPGDSETGDTYRRARALCPDEAPELLHILAGLHTHHLNRGEMDVAFEVAQEQLDLARSADDPAHLLRAHWSVGQALCLRGAPSAAAGRFEQALALYEPSRDRALSHDRSDQAVSLRSWLGWAWWLAGHPDRALAWAEEAVELARRGSHRYSLVYGLGFGAVLFYMLGDRERARQRARETVELSRERGFPLYLAVGMLVGVWADAPDSLGHRGGRAVGERFREALGSLTGRGNQFGRPLGSAALAEILRDSGDPDGALETLRSGLEFSAKTGIRFWDADLQRLRGEILLGRDPGGVEAERCFEEAGAVARRQGARALELRAATSRARLWRRQGREAEARALLEPVYEGFTEGFDTRDLKDAKALLEEWA